MVEYSYMMEKINKQTGGGFIQIIVLLIVVIFIMSYFHLTVSGVVNWFIVSFKSVFR